MYMTWPEACEMTGWYFSSHSGSIDLMMCLSKSDGDWTQWARSSRTLVARNPVTVDGVAKEITASAQCLYLFSRLANARRLLRRSGITLV